MRVTLETKEQTERAILRAAHKLFSRKGFEATTTRHLARAANIATGTLFNYFPTKEALALALITESLEAAEVEFREQLHGGESLEEALFALIIAGLRRLEPHRRYAAAVLETALSPFARTGRCAEADALRARHLDAVAEILQQKGSDLAPSLVTIHLYWSMYLGIVAFWTHDTSEHHTETLALLDHALRLFAGSLKTDQREVAQ